MPFLDLGADYAGVFTLGKITQLDTYDLYIFLYIYYTLKKDDLKNLYKSSMLSLTK